MPARKTLKHFNEAVLYSCTDVEERRTSPMALLRRAALRLPRIAAPRRGLASVAPLNLQAWLDEHGPTLQPPVANKLLFGGDLKVMARRPAPRVRDAKPTLPPTRRSSAGRTRAATTTCRRARSSSCNSRASSA